MAEVDEIALMMAIQAVDGQMALLEESIKSKDEDDDELPDLHEEYMAYMKAAHSLRASYEKALVHGDSLPPFASLVRDNDAKVKRLGII